jgi:SAM-dependent methyltransferase
MTNQVYCPVCGTGDTRHLWSVTCDLAAQHFVLKEKNEHRHGQLAAHIKSLWQGDSCCILECESCGFCFSNPYTAGDMQFYDLAYDRNSYPKWKWEFEKTRNRIIELARSKPLKLIEIGAGDGAFIKQLLPDIINANDITCTEFSDYGKLSIERMGVNCLATDIRNIDPKAAVDVIAMFQVLEHMDDLDVLFKKLNSLLVDCGHLFLSVPNNVRIAFNERNGALLDMPPNHIGRWSKASFEIVAQKHGFKLKEHAVEPFRRLPELKLFFQYMYLRASQRHGSIQNIAEASQNRGTRIVLRCLSLLPLTIEMPFIYFKMNGNLGDSQWVHLVKNA